MHGTMQSQVCVPRVSNSPVGKERQSKESRMELTHVWSCPAMLENPGVWGEGVGLRQGKSEGTTQTECQVHTHRIHTHNHTPEYSHAIMAPIHSPDSKRSNTSLLAIN